MMRFNLPKIKLLVALLSIFTLITACNSDEVDEFIADEPGTMTAKIDGENFKNNGILSIDVDLHIDDQTNLYDLQIDGERDLNGFEERITISLFGTDFTSLQAGDIFMGGANLNNGEKRFDGDYYKKSRIEGDDTDIISDAEQMPPSTATVTKIDFDNRLISGTFSFKSIDIFDENVSFQITDGVFTDINF